ncbi:hypothetical protein ABZ894_10600 [Nocardia beijingensis]|uniref:hypothetical protein n=1 Tax=Nocardia beijingensis TaxID=95162 RepID=UPI0033F7005D
MRFVEKPQGQAAADVWANVRQQDCRSREDIYIALINAEGRTITPPTIINRNQ